MIITSGYTAFVNSELCEGCSICSQFCQFDAIAIINQKAVIDSEFCYGCGVCVDKCEQKAIVLNLDPAKGIPLEINKLMEEALVVN